MSEFAEYQDRLDMREQLARIDRTLVENRKFAAEAQKLSAETANLRVVRFVAPVALVVGAVASLIAAAPVLLRLLPGHP